MPPNPLPLTGKRIVTVALNVPGPMAAERLRELGATVLKIEPPDGDPLQRFSPHWYADLVTGMEVEKCDLKTMPGQARMYALLGDTDLLLTSQRPTALPRLGIGWNELHARFPRLCQVSIVGYPSPQQNIAGHDLTYLAANGLLRPPALPPTLFADVAGSEHAASAALTALLERERTGEGQYIEVALADVAARLAAPLRGGLTSAGAVLNGGHPGYNLYRTQDGWIAVAALEPHFYERLCQRLGVTAPSHEQFAERFAAETNAYWLRFAEDNDVPIEAVAEPSSRG